MNRDDNERWPKIESATLADRVYHVVRQRILQRELSPGTFIREQEVSQATGVSRTPVREALNRLATEDFLERVPHRGFRVPLRSWENLLELYPIIASLDRLAGSLAFERMTRDDLRRLERHNEQLREAGERGDVRAQVELNNAFHQTIARRSGNQRLYELLEQLHSQVFMLDLWYYSVPKNVIDSVREHAQLIEAVRAQDFPRAVKLLEINYDRARQSLEEEMGRVDGEVVLEL
jgi:DNA-binding GntR family transcriptional regulator